MVTKQDGRPSVSPRLLLSSPRTRHLAQPSQHRADPTLRSPGEMVTITYTQVKHITSFGLKFQAEYSFYFDVLFKTLFKNLSMLVGAITVAVCCIQQLVGVRGGLGCWGGTSG